LDGGVNFTPMAGIVSKNQQGKPLLWMRDKSYTGTPYVLVQTWPEHCKDDEDRARLEKAKQAVIGLAKRHGTRVYEQKEITAAIQEYLGQLDEEALSRLKRASTCEDMEVTVTNLVDDKKYSLVVGVTLQHSEP
jgi:hypothetical protein